MPDGNPIDVSPTDLDIDTLRELLRLRPGIICSVEVSGHGLDEYLLAAAYCRLQLRDMLQGRGFFQGTPLRTHRWRSRAPRSPCNIRPKHRHVFECKVDAHCAGFIVRTLPAEVPIGEDQDWTFRMECCSEDQQQPIEALVAEMKDRMVDAMWDAGAYKVRVSYELRRVEYILRQIAALRETQAARVCGWAAVEVPAFESLQRQ